MKTHIPDPANVPGDFYVENDCCLACGIPVDLAPDLFSEFTNGFCYVSKQPTSDAEIHKILDVFAAQDLRCIRYKGKNRIIKIKLIAIGEGEQCDQLDDTDLIALNQEIQADLAIKKTQLK